ncbi:MAG TPA: hypothetical protein VFF65_05515 [Phycisphaerales bacterium]|nr:hypothetical protein [Phycisphaerales bacterium]
MARKLRSMFKPVVPLPGSGERPAGNPVGSAGLGGVPTDAVVDTPAPGGAIEAKGDLDRDAVARLAYERWLATGGGAVENWVWAEAELRRRTT